MTKRMVGSQIVKFDSQPLKVRNRFDFLACRWHVTYYWKFLNEGYNFASYLISIKGLHTKLWPLKVVGVLTLGIPGLPLGSFGTKWHLGDSPMAKLKIYYEPWWILPFHVCPWFIRAPKELKLHTNQLVIWFVQVRVSNWCLSFFLVPIPEL
jgi:hypothetical protein